MKPVALACILFVSTPAWAGDCPLDLGHGMGWVVFSAHSMLAFRPDPPLVEAGQPFALVLNVCTRRGEAAELLSVDSEKADTPSVTSARPIIVPGDNGRYRAEGLLFGQTGRWEITFAVRSDGETESLSHEIVVK